MNIIGMKLFAIALLILTISPAMAHDGIHLGLDFFSGLYHPISGIDHLLVMFGIGIWAAILQEKNKQSSYFMLPVVFLSFMLLGCLLAIRGIVFPHMEILLAAAVIAIGFLLVFNKVYSMAMAILVSVAFALLHGNVHGLEMLSNKSLLSQIMGFVCGTALLQIVGYSLAKQHWFSALYQRLFGLSSCAIGTGLMLLY